MFIASVFVVCIIAMPSAFEPFSTHVFSAALLLGITFLMFCFNLLGAGDSKLLAALGLWIPLDVLPAFMVCMTIAGAVLAAFSLFIRRRKAFGSWKGQSAWIAQLQEGKSAVPYGVAIAAGYIAVTV